jgi:glycosyltransferase involved in cell wall biosynthesis
VRVAFVHDYLTQFGGAERVLLEMHALHPDAPVYTTLYDPSAFGGAFEQIDVRETWLAKIPGARRNFRALLPLYPNAIESIDLTGYDLVISSTTSFAKGVVTRGGTLHVCYMNTPTRFLWRKDEYAASVVPPLLRPFFAAIEPGLRAWDLRASARPDRIIANSENVAKRIRAIYGRKSDVLHCAVSLDGFAPGAGPYEHFLVASRLLPYKRVALAIEACVALGAPLVIVGEGPDESRLRSMSTPSVRFAGRVDDDERRSLFARARAIIVPGEEDFGLVPVEAAASGRPTVAFAAGGALETVVEGETGSFFREPTAQSLADALRALSTMDFDPARLAAHAQRFSPERFRRDFSALIDGYMAGQGTE